MPVGWLPSNPYSDTQTMPPSSYITELAQAISRVNTHCVAVWQGTS